MRTSSNRHPCSRAGHRSSSPAGKCRRCAGPRSSATDGSRTLFARRYAGSVATSGRPPRPGATSPCSAGMYGFPQHRPRRRRATRTSRPHDRRQLTIKTSRGHVDSVAAAGTRRRYGQATRLPRCGARHFVFRPATAGADQRPGARPTPRRGRPRAARVRHFILTNISATTIRFPHIRTNENGMLMSRSAVAAGVE